MSQQQFPSQYPEQQPFPIQQQQQPQWQGQPPQQQYPQQPLPMYPQMPQQQPPRKSRRGLWIGLGVVAVVVLAACIGVAAIVSNAAKTVQTSVNTTLTTVATTGVTTQATTTTGQTHRKIGETVTGSTWQVTVASVKLDTKGDQFTQPKAGYVFVVLHVAVKNVSGQSETLSSLGNFTFRDTNGNSFTEEIALGDKYTAPDGSVQAGEQLQGDLVYQVPVGTKNYILYFQESSFGSSIAEWDVHTA